MDIPVIKFAEPLPCAVIISYIDDEEVLCRREAYVASATPSEEINGGWLLVPICQRCVERMEETQRRREAR